MTTYITVTGNLGSDPELRFTANGTAMATFTVADTDKYKDNSSGEWKTGETSWYKVLVFKDMAEHVSASITRGTRVTVHGKLSQRSWTDREGEKRTDWQVTADDVGVSLRYADAKVTRAERASNSADDWPEGAEPAKVVKANESDRGTRKSGKTTAGK